MNPTKCHPFPSICRICYGPQKTLYWLKYFFLKQNLLKNHYPNFSTQHCLVMNSTNMLQATSSMDYKLHKGNKYVFYFSTITYLIELFGILWGFIPVGQTNLDYFFSLLEDVGSLKIKWSKTNVLFSMKFWLFLVERNNEKLPNLIILLITSCPYQVPATPGTRESESPRLLSWLWRRQISKMPRNRSSPYTWERRSFSFPFALGKIIKC